MNTNILPKKTAIALGVLVVIAFLLGLISSRPSPKQQADQQPTGPYQVTVVGKVTCLPPKDTTGPNTLECAYGLQTADGSYYALNLSSVTTPITNTQSDVVVSGLYSPVEELNTDQWQKYNIQGVIDAKSVTAVEAGSTVEGE